MKTLHEILRQHFFMSRNMTPSGEEYVLKNHFNLEELKKSEWSDRFEKLQRNRMLMGMLRYGKLNSPGKPQYDRVSCAIRRLKKYDKTGNLEHLVDVANMCMLEFEEGRHPNKHFKSVDDGEHTKQK